MDTNLKPAAFLAATLVTLHALPALAATYYVCGSGADCNAGPGNGWSTGNDGNSTAEAQNRKTPWETIDHAEEVVAPGDTVVVGDGTYGTGAQEWKEVVLYVATSGAPGKPITFRAENKWGAVLAGGGTMYGGIWFNCHASPPASHVRVQDFAITDFFESGIRSKDNNGAPYNTRCSGLELSGLRVHHVRHSGIELEATEDSVVERNVIHDIYGGSPAAQNQYHGIYISDNTDNIVMLNNLVYDVPQGWPVHFWDQHDHGGPATNHTVINNTLVNTSTFRSGGIVAFGSGHTIRNNILYEAVSAGSYNYAIGDSTGPNVVAVAENNLTNLSTLCKTGCPSAITNNNTLGADLSKEFTNQSGGDYTQAPNALSIDTGTAAGAPTVDILGNSRPQGAGVDIGAFEFPVAVPTDAGPDAGMGGAGTKDAGTDSSGGSGGTVGTGGGSSDGGKPDGASGVPQSDSDGGCSCAVPGGPTRVGHAGLLLLAFVASLFRRRRAQPSRAGPMRGSPGGRQVLDVFSSLHGLETGALRRIAPRSQSSR